VFLLPPESPVVVASQTPSHPRFRFRSLEDVMFAIERALPRMPPAAD
jgi:hypothetical protein